VETTTSSDEDEDDALSYFQRLVDEWLIIQSNIICFL
jgi:hypothetical protein